MPELSKIGDWRTNIETITLKRDDDIRLMGTDDPDYFRTADSVVAFVIQKPDAKRPTIAFCLSEESLVELVAFGQAVLAAREH